jgi:hypothetical protein
VIFLLEYHQKPPSPQETEEKKKGAKLLKRERKKEEEKEKLQESLQIKGSQYSERRKTLPLQKYPF